MSRALPRSPRQSPDKPGRSAAPGAEDAMGRSVMRRLPALGLLLVSCVAFFACSRPGLKVQKFADGSRELTCDYPLWKCLLHADDYCKGASFEVLYAHDDQHRYGAPGAEVESRTSRAVVHCLGLHQKPASAPGAPVAAAARAPAAPSGAAPPAPPAAPRPAPSRVCVPGTTQACVGPAACSGGQACLPDGSGFSPCDCGSASPAHAPALPASPAATP
jgi:hypothetical protein